MVHLFINTNSLLYGGTASVPLETTKFEHNLKKKSWKPRGSAALLMKLQVIRLQIEICRLQLLV
jgi:hypothetical protein